MSSETAPQRLGEYLRSERERKNITIEQIASATKINIKLLHALELDSYETLPAKPFVRGFITNYARYIGLEPNGVIQRFDKYLDEQAGQKFKRPADAPHIFVERDGASDNSRTVLTVIMGAFLVVGLIAVMVLRPTIKKHHGHKGKLTQISNDDMFTVPLPPGEESAIAPPHHEAVSELKSAPPVIKEPPLAVKAPSLSAKPATAPLVLAPPVVVTKVEQPPKSEAVKSVTPKSIKAAAKAESNKPLTTATAASDTPAAGATAAEPKTEEPKPATEITDKLPAPAANVTAVPPQKLPPIPANEVKFRLIIRAKEDSWVKYQSDDRPPLGYILKKDKTIFIKARSSIRFRSGNPKGIEYSFNDVTFQSFKDSSRSLVIPKESEAEFQNKMFTN